LSKLGLGDCILLFEQAKGVSFSGPRIALFLMIGTLCACSRHQEAAVEPTAVSVSKAVLGDLSRDIVLTAEFKPFQSVDVMAKVAGYVKSIDVDVGSRVRAGQLIATLEIPEMADDLARAQATVERSQSEVKRAQDELQRTHSVRDMTNLSYTRLAGVSKQRPGLVAQQEVDDAQSKDLVAEAQIAAAKSALSASEQQVRVSNAELQRVKTMFDYTRVTAPFAGVITKRFADTGSMIQAGTASTTQAMPLVQLAENTLLRLVLPVPESAVASVHLGQQVEVRVPTLKRTFPGKVARFADTLSMETRTMHTELDVPNPTWVLIPGMYAEVSLGVERRDNVVEIPIAAVHDGQVYIVSAANRIEIRKVETGMQTADLVEIRSGVKQGELVVIGSTSNLQSGEAVKPKLAGS
jgi:RND family efflux transporter MFP subunit